MNKKLIIIPVIALATGCGTQAGATSTVTAPAKTVTVPAAPIVQTKTKVVYKTPQTCKIAILGIRKGSLIENKAFMEVIKGVQTANVSLITDATAKIHKATAVVNKIIPASVDCMSR